MILQILPLAPPRISIQQTLVFYINFYGGLLKFYSSPLKFKHIEQAYLCLVWQKLISCLFDHFLTYLANVIIILWIGITIPNVADTMTCSRALVPNVRKILKISHTAKNHGYYFWHILKYQKNLPQMTVEYFGTNTKDPKYTFHLLSAEPQHLQIQL